MSDQLAITLPDGTLRHLSPGSTAADLAASIGAGLARAALAAVIDGVEADLSTPLRDGASVAIVTAASDQGRQILRHSTAHVLAQAVTDLWPAAKYAIGPPIENGFYYDFDLGGTSFAEDDLDRIEQRMREIVAADQPFEREEYSIQEGLSMFADQPYKVEIIKGVDPDEGAANEAVSAYRNRPDWADLCRGPHVPRTSRLGSFKLQRVSAAYWRGDERNPQLQRIYGTAWESDKALAAHLQFLIEAEQRDHRRLGAELDLFSLPPELGGGLVLWHPKGARVRRIIEDFSRAEHDAGGYELAFTPHLAKSTLWEISGHLDFYSEGMFPPMELDGATYYPKPMNCPFHILIYKNRQHSYRELPIRIFELGTVYRYERSGVLHGLFRARGFTQDDSHIFCTAEQLADELISLLAFVLKIFRTFGFTEFQASLATRPAEKSVGDDAEWDRATNALRAAIEAAGLDYNVDEGGGAFYGPKIDVHIRDAIGRLWQLSTIQVDFQNPERFDMEYVGADNAHHRPVMVHRALFGSVERFFGILVEHYAGAFPTWLAPVQVRVLPVSDAHGEYAAAVVAQIQAAGFRVDVVDADESLNARIRRARMEKLPYVLVVGNDDVASGTVGVNTRGTKGAERDVPIAEVLSRLAAEVAGKYMPGAAPGGAAFPAGATPSAR